MDWLWTNEVAPFSFALLLMFGLGVIELVGLVLGISTLTHSPDTELDANLHLDGATHGLSGLLNWLHIGRAPLLILLVFFLLGFGLSGLLLQQLSQSVLGFLLHGGLVAIPSTLIGLTHMNWGGRFVNRYLPKDETESVSSNSFIGQTVTITVGEARINEIGRASCRERV